MLTRWIGAVEQTIDIFCLASVAAVEPVAAENQRSPGWVIGSSGGSGTSWDHLNLASVPTAVQVALRETRSGPGQRRAARSSPVPE